MAGINEIISKDALKTVERLEKLIAQSALGLSKVIEESKKLNTSVGKLKGDKLKEYQKAQKETLKNSQLLAAEQKKLLNIQTSLKTNTDKVVKAKLLSAKASKEQKDRIRETMILEEKGVNTLQKLLVKNQQLRREREKLDLTDKKNLARIKVINKEIDKNTKVITDNADAAKKQKMNIGNYGSALQGLGSPLGGAIAGIKAFSASLLALLMNPVVLLLAAIAALFAAMGKAMTRSEEGQDRLNKIWRVTQSVLDNVLDVLTIFGVAIFDTLPKAFDLLGIKFNLVILKIQRGFKEAQVAAKSFLGLDVTDLLEELKVINVQITEGTEKGAKLGEEIANGFSGAIAKAGKLGEEIAADIKKAQELADLEAEFNRKEREHIVENAKLANESAKLRTDSEALKKIAAEESIKILEESFKIDQKILDNEMALAKDRVNILKRTSDLASDTIDDKKAIAEAEAQVFAIETRFNELRRQRIRRLNILRLEAFKQENERRKAQLETEKLVAKQMVDINNEIVDSEYATTDEREAAAEQIMNTKIELANESFEIEKAQLEKEFELKLKSQEDFDAELGLLEEKRNSDSLTVNQEYLSNITSIYESATTAAIANTELQATAELLILKQALVDGAITREQFAEEAEAIEQRKNTDIVSLAIKALQDELAAVELSADEKLRVEAELQEKLAELKDLELENAMDSLKQQEEGRQQLADAGIALASQAVGNITEIYKNSLDRQMMDLETQKAAELALTDGSREAQDKINQKYAKKEAELKTKQAKADKTAAIIRAVINTAVAVSSALGLFPPPLGIAMAAIVGIMGALQIATIASKPIPQFAKGIDKSPSVFIAGDAGRELMQMASGDVAMVDQPTLFTDHAGSKIWSNAETEKIMAKGGGYDSPELKRTMERGFGRLNKTIKNKKEFHFNPEKRSITQREGNYYKTYLNQKVGL